MARDRVRSQYQPLAHSDRSMMGWAPEARLLLAPSTPTDQFACRAAAWSLRAACPMLMMTATRPAAEVRAPASATIWIAKPGGNDAASKRSSKCVAEVERADVHRRGEVRRVGRRRHHPHLERRDHARSSRRPTGRSARRLAAACAHQAPRTATSIAADSAAERHDQRAVDRAVGEAAAQASCRW